MLASDSSLIARIACQAVALAPCMRNPSAYAKASADSLAKATASMLCIVLTGLPAVALAKAGGPAWIRTRDNAVMSGEF